MFRIIETRFDGEFFISDLFSLAVIEEFMQMYPRQPYEYFIYDGSN